MKLKLSALMDKFLELQQKIAIYTHLQESLEEYTPSDVDEATELMVATIEYGGVSFEAPINPSLIAEVQDELDNKLGELEKELESLEKIDLTPPAAKKTKTKKTTRKKKKTNEG